MSLETNSRNISTHFEKRLPHPVCDDMEDRYWQLFNFYFNNLNERGEYVVHNDVIARFVQAEIADLNKLDPSRPESFPGIVLVKNPNGGLVTPNILGYKNGLYLDASTEHVYAGSFTDSRLNVIRRVIKKDEEEFASTLGSIIGSVNEAHLKSYI